MNETALPDALKSLRVLIVDDDAFVREFDGDLLHALGVTRVDQAVNGQDALRAIDAMAAPPQLLICDLNMPGMDGIEFLRHLAERGFKCGVILSSGTDRRILKTVESLVQAHRLRFLATLEKPVEESALLAAILNLAQATSAQKGYPPLQPLSAEEIQAALEAGHVDVFFQPKVSLTDRHVTGAEALVRLRHPVRGLVPPGAFISVAEQHGLIDGLTLAIFRKAMDYLGLWARQGHALKAAVNLSMDNLGRFDLPEVLSDIVGQAGADPQLVALEMTEGRLMGDLARSLEIITRLRLKGFNLSIDDFGTGYSSLEKLKQLPFNELKVDRAFVCGAARDEAARAILESSVRLGRALNMNIVAEGVETQADWDLVARAGCNEAQGYFVARPMPADEFIYWKTQWESRQIAPRQRG